MLTPSTFDTLTNPFSSQYKSAMKDMAKLVCEINSMAAVVAELQARSNATPDEVFFRAKITGSTINTSYAIWKYSWSEVEPLNATGTMADFQVMANFRTGSQNAINLYEQGNTSVLAYGIAVNYTGGAWKLTTTPFTSMQFKPVPTGTIVWMRVQPRPTSGTLRYEFQAPNPIDGTCEPP